MLVLALQGSPRKKGNTAFLVDSFVDACSAKGARTRVIHVDREDIKPCKELIVCEKKGTCPIDDTMGREIYTLLRQAEIVVASSPVFFYGVTAQLKALIDRSQTLWARKYRLRLKDPLTATRKGVLFAAAATKGKQLFEGLDLTAKYFFDAIDARYVASLTYRGIENAGEMAAHPTAVQDLSQLASDLVEPLANRQKVVFVSEDGADTAPMAAALAQFAHGDQLEAHSCGRNPDATIQPAVIDVMAEAGIDLAFLRPRSLVEVMEEIQPDIIVSLDRGSETVESSALRLDWEMPRPANDDRAGFQRVRDDIESRIHQLL